MTIDEQIQNIRSLKAQYDASVEAAAKARLAEGQAETAVYDARRALGAAVAELEAEILQSDQAWGFGGPSYAIDLAAQSLRDTPEAKRTN
jgi:hypothetical protein